MSEQQINNHEQLERKIAEAKVVPDIAGRDIGAGVVFLANGQTLQAVRQRERFYFAE